MKPFKILSTIIFAVCFCHLSAQKVNDEDVLNGAKTEYFPNGKVAKQYMMVNGVLNGYYRTYSEKGFLQAEQTMVNGVIQGMVKAFDEEGRLESETNMVDGVPQGNKREFYKDGALKLESFMTGQPWEYSGHSTSYFEDGQVKSESKFSMGKLTEAKTFDKKGRLTSIQSEGNVISYWYENNGKKHTVVNGVEEK